MIIFEGENGIVDYDNLAITDDGTRKLIVRGRCCIRLKNQIADLAIDSNVVKKEACIKLKKLVAELEEELQ